MEVERERKWGQERMKEGGMEGEERQGKTYISFTIFVHVQILIL